MTTHEVQAVIRLLASYGFTVSAVRSLSSGQTELVILLPK